MKKELLLVFFVLFNVNSFGQNIKVLDDKFGFRDIKLESPINSFKDCTRMPLSEELKKEYPNYVGIEPKNPDLHLGAFSLESIEYWFYKDQLTDINIEVNLNNSNVDGILKVLETAYGKAKKNVRVPNKWIIYKWQGSKVNMDYEVLNKESGEVGQATLTITSIRLQNLQMSDKDNADDNKILDAAKKL